MPSNVYFNAIYVNPFTWSYLLQGASQWNAVTLMSVCLKLILLLSHWVCANSYFIFFFEMTQKVMMHNNFYYISSRQICDAILSNDITLVLWLLLPVAKLWGILYNHHWIVRKNTNDLWLFSPRVCHTCMAMCRVLNILSNGHPVGLLNRQQKTLWVAIVWNHPTGDKCVN